ncbi:hypothetical protein RhiirC2_795301 [Rhizophagus irregularis]|uniref:Uncharacterized protein n=1 Tax=Rhizophagus irregularis TaxID=588596 RepID=A0A2N1MBW7_9GLOM|nr:hypothetical protein RhiirC2_795301 [Rhizophagus irregularis]
MNDDNIIGVDECNGEDENSDCTIDIDIDYDENINSFSNKRRACKVIVKEIWEINLKKDFLERNSIQEKKGSLTIKYMLKVHGNSMCAKEFSGFVDENCQSKFKDGPETEIFRICRNSETVALENDPMKKYLQNADLLQIWNIIKGDTSNNSNVWLTLANKAINGAFNDKPVFTRLCHVMVQAYLQKEKGSGLQNLKYSEEFTNFLVILDTLHYEGPIAIMTNNIKLKPGLRYSPQLGCIIGSTFNNNKTKIGDYDQIPQIINKIKSKEALANSVRTYILQILLPKFPPLIIALIPNNYSDKTSEITDFY